MIVFDVDRNRFNFRTVGVCLHNNHVLLHHAEGEEHWTLPGGRVEFGESSEGALQREMREELGLEVQLERLLWIVENFFSFGEVHVHEVAFYYKFQLPYRSGLEDTRRTYLREADGTRLTFQWFPIDGLEEVQFYPSFLRTGLCSIPSHTAHVVHHDVDERNT